MTVIQGISAPLFVPGDRPELFAKAARASADAIIIDLEDAVAPDKKDIARTSVASHGIETLPVIVRINAFASADYAQDIQAALKGKPVAIILPKAESAEQIIATIGMMGDACPIIPLIESAAGLAALPALLAPAQVACVAFGAFDFSLDLGCEATWEPLLLARCELVWRSRVAQKLAPWDSPSATINNPDEVEKEAARAAKLGFGGKLAVHPGQINAIKRAFTPDEELVAWANRVIDACKDGAAVQLDGAMVDRPVLARAIKILSSRKPI